MHAFFASASKKWNVDDFFRSCLKTDPPLPTQTVDNVFQQFQSRWIDSLHEIIHDRQQLESDKDRKLSKANRLVEQWKSGADQSSAKSTIANHLKGPGTVQTTVHGVYNNVVGNNSVTISCDSTAVSSVPDDTTSTPTDHGLQNSSTQSNGRKRRRRKAVDTPIPPPPVRQKTSGDGQIALNNKTCDNLKAPPTGLYSTMDPDKMMKLQSGTVVEETFFVWGDKFDKSHFIHSFVLNHLDKSQEKLFKREEWDEITTHVKNLETQTHNILESPACLALVPDDVNTTTILRRKIFDSLPSEGPDNEWANAAYRNMLFLLEHKDKPLTRSHNESWLEVMLHGTFVYQCLMNVDNIEIVTKEAVSQATRAYLNQDRTETGKGHYLVPSPRLDSIFKLNTLNGLELGACEVSPDNNGTEDTKRINDFNKLVVTLSHMLRRLHRDVKVDRPQELQVVGLLWSGLTLQVLRMSSPTGCVCFLVSDDPVTVPSDEKRIKDVRLVLEAVSRAKDTIQHTANIIFRA